MRFFASLSTAVLALWCGAAQAEASRSFILKCYEIPNKPALCLDEAGLSAIPKCSAATVRMWRSSGPMSMDERADALPPGTCAMRTDTGPYLCEHHKGCGRYHVPTYRATRDPD